MDELSGGVRESSAKVIRGYEPKGELVVHQLSSLIVARLADGAPRFAMLPGWKGLGAVSWPFSVKEDATPLCLLMMKRNLYQRHYHCERGPVVSVEGKRRSRLEFFHAESLPVTTHG